MQKQPQKVIQTKSPQTQSPLIPNKKSYDQYKSWENLYPPTAEADDIAALNSGSMQYRISHNSLKDKSDDEDNINKHINIKEAPIEENLYAFPPNSSLPKLKLLCPEDLDCSIESQEQPETSKLQPELHEKSRLETSPTKIKR